MAKSKVQQIQSFMRPGEGVALNVIKRETISTDGTTGVTFTLDLSRAAVPDRRYVADISGVLHSGDQVRLVFGQSNLTGKGYRSAVIVQMSSTAVHLYVKSMVQVGQSLRTYVERNRIPKVTLSEFKEEPAQTVALVANITAVSFAGREACLDFYHVSPFVIHQLTMGGSNFLADAVVRITLPTAMLLAIVDRVGEVSSLLPPEKEEGLT